MPRLFVRLSDDNQKVLDALCKKTGLKKSAVIVLAIRRYLAEEGDGPEHMLLAGRKEEGGTHG
jgi:predicted transcriptional regulator